jgi:hypothetical protein
MQDFLSFLQSNFSDFEWHQSIPGENQIIYFYGLLINPKVKNFSLQFRVFSSLKDKELGYKFEVHFVIENSPISIKTFYWLCRDINISDVSGFLKVLSNFINIAVLHDIQEDD